MGGHYGVIVQSLLPSRAHVHIVSVRYIHMLSKPAEQRVLTAHSPLAQNRKQGSSLHLLRYANVKKVAERWRNVNGL